MNKYEILKTYFDYDSFWGAQEAGRVGRDGDGPMPEKLRPLRAAIVWEEELPPYIVFSDKTLVHMCIVRPVNKEEILIAAGVGELNHQKDGERFQECVREAGKWNYTS